jgi:hypothetical protein
MQSGSKSSGPIVCWGCGKEGVTLYECTNPSCIKKNKVKQERKQASYNQGQKHFNIKIDDSMEGKQHINMKIAKSGETENIKNESDTEYFGYDVGVSFHQANETIKDNNQRKDGELTILLDSQSTHSTFHDAELVENIRDAITPLKMKTNGGVII